MSKNLKPALRCFTLTFLLSTILLHFVTSAEVGLIQDPSINQQRPLPESSQRRLQRRDSRILRAFGDVIRINENVKDHNDDADEMTSSIGSDHRKQKDQSIIRSDTKFQQEQPLIRADSKRMQEQPLISSSEALNEDTDGRNLYLHVTDTDYDKKKKRKQKKSADDDSYSQMTKLGRVGRRGDIIMSLKQLLKDMSQLKSTVNQLRTQNNFMYKQLKLSSTLYQQQLQPQGAGCVQPINDAAYVSMASQDVDSMTSQQAGGASAQQKNAILSDTLRLDKTPRSLCPDGFKYYSEFNGCYLLEAERVTWRMARDRCMARNSDLVTVESSRKQKFVAELAKNSPDTRHCDLWIGLTRSPPRTPGGTAPLHTSEAADWAWSATGEPLTFSHWNQHEPNNGKGNEHCAQMLWLFAWRWNDAACNYGNACYACQVRPRM